MVLVLYILVYLKGTLKNRNQEPPPMYGVRFFVPPPDLCYLESCIDNLQTLKI